jgi:hypothetical protein
MLKRRPSPTGAENSQRTGAGKGEGMSAQTAESGFPLPHLLGQPRRTEETRQCNPCGDSRASWGKASEERRR